MKKNIKYIVFTCCFFMIVIIFTVLFLFFADMYYHKKFLRYAGLNYRGYRGEIAGNKRPNEVRIAMLGGSFIFGYGIKYLEALPAHLERILNSKFSAEGCKKRIQVINLAYPSEGVYASYYNLKDFEYLKYDYVLLCEGYNDLGACNTFSYRHSDPIFRTFGYMPILPLCLKEKIRLLNSGNSDLKGQKIVFQPNQKERVTVLSMEKALTAYNNFHNLTNRLSGSKITGFNIEKLKTDRWSWYKYFMQKSIDFCLSKNSKVIVITPPFLGKEHEQQQLSAKEMLETKYSSIDGVIYLNLGDSIDLNDSALSFDGLHLTSKGSELIAGLIADAIIDNLKAESECP